MQDTDLRSRYAEHWDYIAASPQAIRRKFGITYLGRSGSFLLSGLLDYHSHIISFVYPADLSLYPTLKTYFSSGAADPGGFEKLIRENIDRLLDYSFAAVPEENKQIDLDMDLFFENLNAIVESLGEHKLNIDLAFNVIYIAYGKTRNLPLLTKSPILVIQRHKFDSNEELEYLHENFTNPRIAGSSTQSCESG